MRGKERESFYELTLMSKISIIMQKVCAMGSRSVLPFQLFTNSALSNSVFSEAIS